MSLNDRACKNAKPKAKTYRESDGLGLYLEVVPNGSKYWRFKYRFGGKEKRLALGVYPLVGLKDARNRRDAARKQISNGVDPSAAKRAAKIAQAGADSTKRRWRAHARHFRLPRAIHHALRAATLTIAVCAPRRVARCGMAGVRPRCGRMAHSRLKDEDAGGAHRAAEQPSCRNPAR